MVATTKVGNSVKKLNLEERLSGGTSITRRIFNSGVNRLYATNKKVEYEKRMRSVFSELKRIGEDCSWYSNIIDEEITDLHKYVTKVSNIKRELDEGTLEEGIFYLTNNKEEINKYLKSIRNVTRYNDENLIVTKSSCLSYANKIDEHINYFEIEKQKPYWKKAVSGSRVILKSATLASSVVGLTISIYKGLSFLNNGSQT